MLLPMHHEGIGHIPVSLPILPNEYDGKARNKYANKGDSHFVYICSQWVFYIHYDLPHIWNDDEAASTCQFAADVRWSDCQIHRVHSVQRSKGNCRSWIRCRS